MTGRNRAQARNRRLRGGRLRRCGGSRRADRRSCGTRGRSCSGALRSRRGCGRGRGRRCGGRRFRRRRNARGRSFRLTGGSLGGGRSGTARGRRDRLERGNGFGGRLRLRRRGRGFRGGRRARRSGRRGGRRGCGGLRSGAFRFGLGRGRGLQEHAAHQVSNVVWNDAQLVLCFKNPAKTFVKEGDQLFRREPNLFRKFKYPNFSGSQILPFTLAGVLNPSERCPEGACIGPQFIGALLPQRGSHAKGRYAWFWFSMSISKSNR